MPTNSDEIHSTTQTFLDIYDITNDTLINKDGSTALILQVNALNFGLLAEEEQDAIMYAYAGLLNSLNYPIQIIIRSQTKDVTNYLNLLKEEEEKAASENKKNRISRYREFVSELIRERNVLDKKFYVVIPASALEMGLLPPSTVIPGVKQPDLTTVERSVILDKAREILDPKRDHLISQFGRIGLVARQLSTQEIIQLFYLSYNPEAAEGQQITDTNSYTTPLVRASVQGGPMADATPQTVPNPATPAVTPATPAQTPVAPTVQPAASATPATPAATPANPPMTTPAAPVASAQPNIQEQAAVTAPNPAAAPAAPASAGTITPPPAATPAPEMTPPAAAPTPTAPMPPAAPGTPAAPPAQPAPAAPSAEPAAMPADKTPEGAAQEEINSTLQQLGGDATTATTGDTSKSPTDELPPVAEI